MTSVVTRQQVGEGTRGNEVWADHRNLRAAGPRTLVHKLNPLITRYAQ